jgi:hypothetical protein
MTHHRSRSTTTTLGRATAFAAWAISSLAHAQNIGQNLYGYATPIILFLGVGAILVALLAAVFRPELVRSAVWAAVLLVVVFFILKNTAALQAAVQ